MLTWRYISLLIAAGACLALSSPSGTHAQEAPGSAAAPGTAQEEAIEPAAALDQEGTAANTAALEAFIRALDGWATEIETQEKAIADDRMTDSELIAVPSQLEALREAIVEQRAILRPELQDARERLGRLGSPPEEGAPPESPEIAAQRQQLESDVASIDGKLKQSDVLFVRAGQLIEAANDKRRERFTESLFRPVPSFYTSVLPRGFDRLPKQFQDTASAFAERFARIWDKGAIVFILIFAAPLAAFVFVRRFLGRTALAAGADTLEDPSLQQRGTRALRNTIRDAMPVLVAFLALYLVAASAGLADPSLAGFLPKALLFTGWAVFLIILVGQSLVPDDERWRVIPADNAVARRVASLLRVLIAVWLIDQLLVLTDTIVFAPYQFSVLRSAFFAIVYGLLVAAILWTIQNGPIMRKSALSGWRAWLFSFTAAVAGIIVVAALLGYEALARFMGTHVVSTVGILWVMYLLHLAAESISSVSVVSGQPIDDDAIDEKDMGAPSLLTLRIIGSLLLDIVILAVGITVLLLLWRFDWVEVKGWIQAAFFGFEFGNLRISLQSILIAVGVFALGLLLTRFVQHWFTGRVFADGRSHSGVQESIRVGIGYVGFVLAALAGVSYLGVDFSNLAIIAGALSVGIGFGLQSIFNNFVSGLILLIERPIKIGDYIQVGDQEGTVKKISVRSTEIETIHRYSLILPNATLITDPVVNWMHPDRRCRLDIPVGVDYGTDIELLRSTLLDVAKQHPAVLTSPPPVVHFAGFGDSSLDFELRVFLRDVGRRITSLSELRFAILEALRKASISIPFPQRDLHIKGEASGDAGSPAQTPKSDRSDS